jgi:hypothetical protein
VEPIIEPRLNDGPGCGHTSRAGQRDVAVGRQADIGTQAGIKAAEFGM